MTESCLADDELLAAATDDAVANRIRQHVDRRERCQNRIRELRREVGALRSFSRLSAAWGANSGSPTTAAARIADSIQYDRIGRYVVVGRLGSGGQAEVYRVIDPDLARPLVLKLSRRVAANGEAHRGQAVAEGKLLASLDHPGLICVFDVGVFDDRPYLVLEYVPGRNLEQYCEVERPSSKEAVRIVCEAALALAYAHSRGVIHGDVTPRNIMIDAEGRVRLIDFGLARLEHIWCDNSEASGGTPAFLPPELLFPDGLRRLGPATDVFGLGATLYWMLTGRGPFAAASVAESLALARQGEIDFALLRVMHAPRRLMQLCEQMLSRDPAPRPTASECAKRLSSGMSPLCAIRSKAAIIIVLLAALLLLELVKWAPKKSVVLSVPEVNVLRDNELVNLKTVLPIRTGDQINMRFVVGPGEEVTAVWLDARGRIRRLSTDRTPDDEVDRFRYPVLDRYERVKAPEGTDMIFICRGRPIADRDLQACFPGTPPPAIPDQVFLQLQRLREVAPMGPLPPHSKAAADVALAEEYMLKVDAKLRRHFEGVRGVAFSHRGPAEESEDAPAD